MSEIVWDTQEVSTDSANLCVNEGRHYRRFSVAIHFFLEDNRNILA